MRGTLSKKQLSLHKQAALDEELTSIQNTQLTADNILDKLLHPSGGDKKHLQNMKYRPKFERRDYQTLSQENVSLKQQLNEQRGTVTQLKFRLSEMERKVKFLQGIQQKWEESVQEGFDGRRLQVYTQILKKKIQELNELYLNSEQKIKELKRLPHVSVFEEQSVEMQQFKRETIRLKAIISSMSDGEGEQDNLQNKFLKLMKEENEKLKSTIRLLENDKNLLKSRLTIQKRHITDYRKEIEQLRKKLSIREAEIEKIQNETKNILLKKAFQLKSDQQKRENEEIDRLKSVLQQQRLQMQRMQAEKEQLSVEYHKLKKNEKLIESKQTNEDKEKSELKSENSRLRRTIEELKVDLDKEKENIRVLEHQNRKKRKEAIKPIVSEKVQRLVPVRFEEIELGLLLVNYALESSALSSIAHLFQEQELRCGRLVQILSEQPVGMERGQAMKVVRYLTESAGSAEYNEKGEVNKSLAMTILRAAVNKMLECRNSQNEDTWRCLLARARKLVPELEKLREQSISKQNFLGLLSRHINENFGEWVSMIVLQSFDPVQSQSEVMLGVGKILQALNNILLNRTSW